MNRKTIFTILQLVIFVGLGIALIYWKAGQMTAEQKQEMYTSMRSVRAWYLLPVLLVGFLSHYFRALRWRLLLEPLDIKPTRSNTFFAVMIGYLVNVVLPRIGEVAKCTVLAKYEKVPADKMVGTIVAERAFDVVCLILVIVGGFLIEASVIGGYARGLLTRMQEQNGNSLLYLAIGLAVCIVLVLIFYQRIRRTRIGHAIKGIADGVRSIMHLRHRTLFIVYTFLIWIGYISLVILGFKSIPATEDLTPMAALVILGFGSIGMILTPGGFGAYPVIVSQILLLYGVGGPDALAFGWVSWAAQTGVVVVLGLLSLILLPIYNRTAHNAQAGLDTAENH